MEIMYERGACVDLGVADLFFSEDVNDLAEAQKICGECAVRIACLESALEEDAEWGVWGGVIFWDGVPFYRRRGRGRPRKDEPAVPLQADRNDLWRLVKSA